VRDADLAHKLRTARLKVTPGRVRLLRLLAHAHTPLTVPAMRQRLRGVLDEVSVYRALASFAKARLVRRGSDGRTARSQYASGRPYRHHFVCVDCGSVRSCNACAGP
jgi:Fe2+ or Zn2+ uptake regulation protein